MNSANKKSFLFPKLMIAIILFSCGIATINAQIEHSEKDSAITIFVKEKVPKILPKIDSKIKIQPTFRIVCAPSLKSEYNPIYILDGKIIDQDKMSKINPSVINKVDVLKGTSATALYAAKGKNGVIIITSKQNFPNRKN